jgi:hypothetical protein
MKARLDGISMVKVWSLVGSFSKGEIAFDLEVRGRRVVEAKLVHLRRPCAHDPSSKTMIDVDEMQTVRETCNVCGSVFTYPWFEDRRQSAHQEPVFDPRADVWIPDRAGSKAE